MSTSDIMKVGAATWEKSMIATALRTRLTEGLVPFGLPDRHDRLVRKYREIKNAGDTPAVRLRPGGKATEVVIAPEVRNGLWTLFDGRMVRTDEIHELGEDTTLVACYS